MSRKEVQLLKSKVRRTMRYSQNLIAFAAFFVAALISVMGASWAASVIESRSSQAVTQTLRESGLEFAVVKTDGLQIHLSGTAPTEAARFRALAVAGSVVDAARIRDKMDVTPVADIEAPRFSVELLRNDDGISLIGLIPSLTGNARIVDQLSTLVPEGQLTDMLETADYPVPAGWDAALDYGLQALRRLPRSKISISAREVKITAISDSEAEKRKLEAELARNAPKTIRVAIDISAPRPVITPFTLRFVIDESGARFDACSADTEKARTAIIAAAISAGTQGKINCTVGLGVPTPRWSEAVRAGISAVSELGGGSITFSDADVSLIATETTPQSLFDRVVGDLGAKLPDVFSLAAILPEKPKTAAAEGPAEFTATLSPEGQVQLRGRLTDERLRDAVDAYAKSRFGAGKVYSATRLDPELPDGWPVRVLAGLESLAQLVHGSVTVRADMVEVTGITGSTEARDVISRVLSDKLGQSQEFRVAIDYDERLDPLAALPTPQECVSGINKTLNSAKITFAPGSAEVDPGSRATLDAVAELLKQCSDVPMEIGGHTDSQGRDQMNLSLSQSRAESVLNEMLGRRVPVSNLTAKGYGESNPIASNSTEEGREANRRIEVKLLVLETPADPPVEEPAEEPTQGTVKTAATGDTTETSAPAEESGTPQDVTDPGSGDGVDEPSEGVVEDGSDNGTEAPAPQETSEPAGSEEPYDSAAPTEKTQRPTARP